MIRIAAIAAARQLIHDVVLLLLRIVAAQSKIAAGAGRGRGHLIGNSLHERGEDSLGDALGQSVGPERVEIASGVDAQEVAVLAELERPWGAIRAWLAGLLQAEAGASGHAGVGASAGLHAQMAQDGLMSAGASAGAAAGLGAGVHVSGGVNPREILRYAVMRSMADTNIVFHALENAWRGLRGDDVYDAIEGATE